MLEKRRDVEPGKRIEDLKDAKVWVRPGRKDARVAGDYDYN